MNRLLKTELNRFTSRFTIINSKVVNLTTGKIKLNVFSEIIFYLVEVSLSKDGSKVKVPCNVIDDRIFNRL